MNMLKNLSDRNARQTVLRAAVVVGTSLLAATHASAQALQPVVRASSIAQATVVAVALAILTVSWGMAGYKMAFGGASFRDVAGPMIGGAIGGAAATVAAVFIA